MAVGIQKIKKDEINNIMMALDPEINGDGSAFEIVDNQITTTISFRSGLGKFDGNFLAFVSSGSQEIYPSNDETLLDEIFELDANNDLTPKQ